jgi:tetrahydromethanopterin S-methyltransferase subunit A
MDMRVIKTIINEYFVPSHINGAIMGFDMYPWSGEFVVGNVESPVAVVTLGKSLNLDKDLISIFGPDKTENLGIEKVIANIISNPNIRFLVVCGPEVRGHMSGNTIRALYENGIDENNRVNGAKGAVPYIENIPPEAIDRFQKQVKFVDLIDEEDVATIHTKIRECIAKDPGPMDEPFVVLKIERVGAKGGGVQLDDMLALHSSLAIDPYGEFISLLIAGGDVKLHNKVSMDVYGRITEV